MGLVDCWCESNQVKFKIYTRIPGGKCHCYCSTCRVPLPLLALVPLQLLLLPAVPACFCPTLLGLLNYRSLSCDYFSPSGLDLLPTAKGKTLS